MGAPYLALFARFGCEAGVASAAEGNTCPLIALQTQVEELEDGIACGKEQSRPHDDEEEAAWAMQHAGCPIQVSLAQGKK